MIERRARRVRCINDDGTTFSAMVEGVHTLLEVQRPNGQRAHYVRIKGQSDESPVLLYVLYTLIERDGRLDEDEVDAKTVKHISGTVSADGKSLLATEWGRLGGLKGGRASAERLTPAQRSARARKAALTRWRHKPRTPTDGLAYAV